MDLATVLLLHKSSFIVGAICFFYVRWRSRELGLGLLAVGWCLLGIASTLAGMGEQGLVPFELWTLGSFSVGTTGYSLMTMGLIQLSRRQAKNVDWLAVAFALLLSAIVGVTHWYADNQTRAAIFNASTAAFLLLCGAKIAQDFLLERLPARMGVLASISIAAGFSVLVTVGMVFPEHAPIEPRYAFFLLIICHFSLALFVLVLVQERVEAKLIHLANTDILTGIPNRQCFFASLPEKPRAGDAFLMIDIDHFKTVNDRYGHETGDTVLIGVAQAISSVAGTGAVFGRIGGEEFGVLLRDRNEASAFEKADEIRASVKRLAFPSNSTFITPSVSVGVALYQGADDFAKLRGQADQALYMSKQRGRDRVELYVEERGSNDRAPDPGLRESSLLSIGEFTSHLFEPPRERTAANSRSR